MNNTELYDSITNTIIELLQEHKANNYESEWFSVGADPFALNVVSNHVYTGINQLLLSFIRRRRNYKCNRWLTFNQIQKFNASIVKGSKSTMVVYTSVLYIDAESGRNVTRIVEGMQSRQESIEHMNLNRIGYLKHYNVFNVECVTGLPEMFYAIPELDNLTDIERNEKAEQFINGVQPTIVYGGDEAFYLPSRDVIQLPLSAQFKSTDSFYSVLFHELGHWTGAEHRLNRPLKNKFGSEAYAFEELIAELNSAFVLASLGFSSRISQNAAYIDNWLQCLEHDNKFVVSAASQAQAATSYLWGLCVNSVQSVAV